MSAETWHLDTVLIIGGVTTEMSAATRLGRITGVANPDGGYLTCRMDDSATTPRRSTAH